MKPYLSTLIIIASTAFFCSCKKAEKQSPSRPIYLVKQQIVEFTNYPIAQNDTTQYNYDSYNRLTNYGLIYKGKYEPEFTYSYDSNGRVAGVIAYNTVTDTVLSRLVLTYGTNSFTMDSQDPNGQQGHYLYTLNNKQQAVRYDSKNYYVLYTYDTNGNITSYKVYAQPGQPTVSEAGIFSYDNNKNPFFALKGNYAFVFGVFSRPNACINNPIGNLQYQYNSDGYPTKVTDHDPALGAINTYYIYTVK
jgi:hypothetical protein